MSDQKSGTRREQVVQIMASSLLEMLAREGRRPSSEDIASERRKPVRP